ncbi:MAG: carboxypeptidase regulatory-like domain-containing protein, partial [Blastocatellia bacterium]|nr:carboxypeptidase regulatory-like domain-containing protein [Blastocatellia bacterium]
MFALKKLLPTALVLCFLALTAVSQEFRGQISGRIIEASGAAVPGAVVTVVNTATNSSVNATTNDSGEYTVLYLTPGSYMISIEAKGFKKSVRQNIEVRIGDKLALDVTLEVGAVTDSVNITSDAPLLETTNASAGQVIDQRRISELPLSDGNPFTLARVVPGITFNGDLKFSRPFDNGGASAIVADGAPGRNEFTLDGVPNMASGGGVGRVAFVPPADAVQEFKVETASFDAQTSHTAGATVNVTLKSGTNAFHGTAYEFVRNDVLSANDFFINRTNLTSNPSRDANKDGKADRDPLRYNRYGGTIGGPVFLPRFGIGGKPYWNGQNRSFFFFAYEGLKDKFPEPALFTVPTVAQRTGDFSALLPSIVIYDPTTAVRLANGRVQRTAFANNIIPASRLSPIALNYLKYYPLPNQPGDAQGRNNYISGNPRTDNFRSESVRFDQTISERQKFFVRYTHNNRREARGNWGGVVNGLHSTGNYLFRINNGGAFDHVISITPTMILNSRVGFTRFNEPNVRQHEGEFNPASLGFPAATAALFGPEQYLPRFEIGGLSVLGDSIGGSSNHNIYTFQPTLTKLAGKHSFRLGYDFRSYRENGLGAGHAAGRYDFSSAFTQGPLDNSPGAAIGQQTAAFLLGQTTGGIIDRNTARSNQTLYHGMFFHDDWKISQRLTLNLGLRYEYEGATTERYNRNIRTFNLTVTSPIEAAAKTAYAAAPIPELPASNFNVKGGLVYLDANNRAFWGADKNNFQPRIGAAFKLDDKTVLRGGWGVYTVPFVMAGIQQTGFSLATNIVASGDAGLTFLSNLANPFPTGVQTPPGASNGISTLLGQNIPTFLPADVNNTQAQRWEFGFQRELPGQWLFELSYVGNRGYEGVVGTNILNAVPRQYLSTSNVRDNTVINFLSANVTNPFRNLIPGTGLNGTTTSRAQLLRPFPSFGTITTIRNDGSSNYNSAQLKLEKRFSGGYTLLTSYTWSKFLVRDSFLNEVDTEYERRISDADVPHRLVVSGIWEVPFGRGRLFGRDMNRALDAIVGGWQFAGIWNWQSGLPITIGNVYYNGDPTKLKSTVDSSRVDTTTFDISGFYFHDAAVQTNGVDDPAKQRADTRIRLGNNIRTLPSRWTGFRQQKL